MKLSVIKDTWVKRDTRQASQIPMTQKFEMKVGQTLEVNWLKYQSGHSECSLVKSVKGFHNWYIWNADFESDTPLNFAKSKLSEAGTKLVSSFEGYENKLPDGRAKAYWDALGAIWTIGYGSTRYYDDEGNSRPVKQSDIITHDQALAFKAKDVAVFAKEVERVLGKINDQGQLDALISLAYNAGSGALEGSICRAYKNNNMKAVADAFLLWNKTGSPLKPAYGLSRRRAAERAMFLGEDWLKYLGPYAERSVLNVYGSASRAGL